MGRQCAGQTARDGFASDAQVDELVCQLAASQSAPATGGRVHSQERNRGGRRHHGTIGLDFIELGILHDLTYYYYYYYAVC